MRVRETVALSLPVPIQPPPVCVIPFEDATLNVDHPPQIDATLKPRDHLFFFAVYTYTYRSMTVMLVLLLYVSIGQPLSNVPAGEHRKGHPPKPGALKSPS